MTAFLGCPMPFSKLPNLTMFLGELSHQYMTKDITEKEIYRLITVKDTDAKIFNKIPGN